MQFAGVTVSVFFFHHVDIYPGDQQNSTALNSSYCILGNIHNGLFCGAIFILKYEILLDYEVISAFGLGMKIWNSIITSHLVCNQGLKLRENIQRPDQKYWIISE